MPPRWRVSSEKTAWQGSPVEVAAAHLCDIPRIGGPSSSAHPIKNSRRALRLLLSQASRTMPWRMAPVRLPYSSASSSSRTRSSSLRRIVVVTLITTVVARLCCNHELGFGVFLVQPRTLPGRRLHVRRTPPDAPARPRSRRCYERGAAHCRPPSREAGRPPMPWPGPLGVYWL